MFGFRTSAMGIGKNLDLRKVIVLLTTCVLFALPASGLFDAIPPARGQCVAAYTQFSLAYQA